MKICVTGGRDYQDEKRVFDVLAKLRPTVVIQGGCPTGADAFARRWAEEAGVTCVTYEADWKQHSRAASPMRNREMLVESTPNIVVSFPGGRGTKHCTETALALKIPTYRVIEDGLCLIMRDPL